MKTRKTFAVIFVVAALLCMSAAAYAADSATQTVTFEVQAINEISVSGNPGPLVVNAAAATAGGALVADTDSSTTYSVTTNDTGKKITAGIDAAMPTGTTLAVKLASSKATSAGEADISAATAGAEVDVVTGLSTCTDSGQTITYTFSATAAAGVVSGSKTVTFTIVDA